MELKTHCSEIPQRCFQVFVDLLFGDHYKSWDQVEYFCTVHVITRFRTILGISCFPFFQGKSVWLKNLESELSCLWKIVKNHMKLLHLSELE